MYDTPGCIQRNMEPFCFACELDVVGSLDEPCATGIVSYAGSSSVSVLAGVSFSDVIIDVRTIPHVVVADGTIVVEVVAIAVALDADVGKGCV